MKTSSFLVRVVGLLCCVSILHHFSLGEEPSRPNVVLIMADDMGYSDIGCYGGEIVTPHLDELASKGVRFSHFFNNAKCAPTRATLLTGRWVQAVATKPQAGLPNLRADNNVTIAEILRAHGYGTYMTGKWHLGSEERAPESRGFDLVFANDRLDHWTAWETGEFAGEGVTEAIPAAFADPFYQKSFYQPIGNADCAISFLEHHRETRSPDPFFLYLSFSVPHTPLSAPLSPEYIVEKEEIYSKGWHQVREERWAKMKSLGLFTEQEVLPPISDNVKLPDWNEGEVSPDWKADSMRRMILYCKMVEEMDRAIGRLIESLKAKGDFDNTLILFLSDNGPAYGTGLETKEAKIFGSEAPLSGKELARMGSREDTDPKGAPSAHARGYGWSSVSHTPFRLNKGNTHNGGIASPLIVSWPERLDQNREGAWVSQIGHVADILPTVLEATGVEYDPDQFQNREMMATTLDGMSLLASTCGDVEEEVARWIPLDHTRAQSLALIKNNWKLVVRKQDSWDRRFPAATPELYQLKTDPFELDNQAANKPARVKTMMEEWNTWASQWPVLGQFPRRE